jgi:putative endonuclease
MPFVYIARCSDGTLYVGHTSDLESREQTHNEGHGARYTAVRRPVRIVYAEQFTSLVGAKARERQLKGWTTIKKEALVGSNTAELKGISSRLRRKRNA